MSKALTIKGTLNKRLKDEGRKVLLPAIDEACLAISQMAYKASLVFNVYLVHILQHDLPFPEALKCGNSNLMNQFFKIGLNLKGGKVTKKSDKILHEVWRMYFNDFPVSEKQYSHMTRLIDEAGKTYNTAFFNHLKGNFYNYQARYLKLWCQDHDIELRPVRWDVINAINAGKPIESQDLALVELVKEHRTMLKEPVRVTESWIERNPEPVVRYFYHMLQYLEGREDARGFTLAPIHHIKRHCIAISVWTLRELLMHAEVQGVPSVDLFYGRAREYFDRFFQLNDKRRRYFAWRIMTDGVHCSLLYAIPIGKKVHAQERRLIKSIERDARKRTIAIDPGRVNILFGVEILGDGTHKTYRYSRRRYYHEAGMTKARERLEHWYDNHKAAKKAEEAMAGASPKCTTVEGWIQVLGVHIKHYHTLWDAKTQARWSQERFRLHCLKKRSQDRFLNEMDAPGEARILYGGAKFASTGKGEVAVPTTGIFMAVQSKFKETVLVHEHRTSKVCQACDGTLSSVHEDGREVRGLRWCKTCRKFLDRDRNAALNILRCDPRACCARPQSLCSDTSKLVLGKFYKGQRTPRSGEAQGVEAEAPCLITVS